MGEATKHPINQLVFSKPAFGSFRSLGKLPLLAARSQYWITIHQPCVELATGESEADAGRNPPQNGQQLSCSLQLIGSMLANSRYSLPAKAGHIITDL